MKLFYLLVFSFLIIALSIISLHKSLFPQKVVVVSTSSSASQTEDLPDLPFLSESSGFPVLSAQSVLAADLESGITLYEKNPDGMLLPASTTKMITALVALDYYSLDTVLKVDGVFVEGQKMGLYEGEEIAARDLLYGLLVYSANDAAEVLANNYCDEVFCGRDIFVEAMNRKAYELGLTKTHFENPSGLEGDGHITSARDLLTISKIAMRDPFFRKAVSTKMLTVKSVDGKFVHRLENINQLLGEVDGVLGVKTGWTENARENLVAYVERNNRKVMTVVLGSQDRFGETKELIEWIFNNYEWKTVSEPAS